MEKPNCLKIVVVFAVLCLSLALFPTAVKARTLDEIQQDIDNQQAALNGVQGQLAAAEQNLKNLQGSLASTQGEIPKLEAQIKEIEAQIELNNLQMQVLSEDKKLKELEHEERTERQDRVLKSSYLDWRSNQSDLGFYLGGNQFHPLKQSVYQLRVMKQEDLSIEELAAEVDSLDTALTQFQEETGNLAKQNEELKVRKQQLQQQIVALQSNINNTSGAISGMRGQIAVLQANISQLSAEQKALQDYEAWILGQSGNGGTLELQPGQYYLTGRGRDLYQGHGVGMSQFGAYGAAESGWSAQQIVQFYYQGTTVQSSSGSVTVDGYGTMDLNAYVAGQGEVPSKACGSAEQVQTRPDKYALNDPATVWDCWPEEAIKAQAIAYRTYALNWMQTKGASICTTASCQVYNGTRLTQWAADETQNLVLLYGGAVIEALYSSDNNQGYGTADNDTVWSGYSGYGTPYPYLRSVNDSSFTHHFTWTDWAWRTNGYSLSAFTSMLQFASSDGYLSAGSRSYVAAVLGQIGEVASVNFIRDPSQRVRRVVFTGTNGVSQEMAGWLFKIIWNSWVDQQMPTGQKDFIYSLTFFLLVR